MDQRQKDEYTKSAQAFRDFVATLIGYDFSSLDRYINIVQHKQLFKAIEKFLLFPWSRLNFSTSNAFKIIGPHIDFVSSISPLSLSVPSSFLPPIPSLSHSLTHSFLLFPSLLPPIPQGILDLQMGKLAREQV